MIKPINNQVLIKTFKEEKKGVVEPDTLEGMPEIGIVEAWEEGCRVNGVKEGDKVFFDKYLATELKHKGEKYYLIAFEDIKAIIEED